MEGNIFMCNFLFVTYTERLTPYGYTKIVRGLMRSWHGNVIQEANSMIQRFSLAWWNNCFLGGS
jgi:hypothetical protein